MIIYYSYCTCGLAYSKFRAKCIKTTVNIKLQLSLREAANTQNNPVQKSGVQEFFLLHSSSLLYPHHYQNKDTRNHNEADRIRYTAIEKLGGDNALIFQFFHLTRFQIF